MHCLLFSFSGDCYCQGTFILKLLKWLVLCFIVGWYSGDGARFSPVWPRVQILELALYSPIHTYPFSFGKHKKIPFSKISPSTCILFESVLPVHTYLFLFKNVKVFFFCFGLLSTDIKMKIHLFENATF